MEKNPIQARVRGLDSICAALCYAMGVEKPALAAEKNEFLAQYVDLAFSGEKADRVIMFNPDAIARWIYEKYPYYMRGVREVGEMEIPLTAVMPSVTPVCFGTMYTGALPEVHGIQSYEKPVITIDTLFDALIRAGKKPALVTYGNCSLGRIYLERDMDYFHFDEGGTASVNAKAMELILRDEHDFILIYNGNYDTVMHKFGPESPEALSELRLNAHVYTCLARLIAEHLQGHNTLLGFAMDHGCHEIDGGCGSHGLDMPEDLDITHLYHAFPKKK